MMHASGFTVILDANVLYPAPVRDMLLYLASADGRGDMTVRVFNIILPLGEVF